MGRVADRSKLSPEEYLAWERTQERKHEYFDGEVFAMAGGSPRHNRLIMTVGIALDGPLTACGWHRRRARAVGRLRGLARLARRRRAMWSRLRR